MAYQITALQNSSAYVGNSTPTIVIKRGDPEWPAAFQNWLQGKPPTDAITWKAGIFAITSPIQEQQS